jgi:Ras-related protein Rab-21
MSDPARPGGRPGSGRRKYKFVLLGEGRVGKTSILLRFCKNEFDLRQPPTLNASYMDRKVHIDGTPVQLSIWDTAGQERFHALGPIYYRDAGECGRRDAREGRG